MATVKRVWARLLLILMTLVRSLGSCHSGLGADAESALTRIDESTQDELTDSDSEQGLHAQGVTQGPPPPSFQPMQQPAWHFWNEGDADDTTWAVLENQRIRSRQTAALLG
jgi:hypothetical protein